MRTKIAAVSLVVLLVCCLAVLQAHAQGKCSLETFAGTYVIYEKGSSLTIDLSSTGVLGPPPFPTSPPAWIAPGIVPFVNLSEVTFTRDGVGDGFFWIYAGSIGATRQPIPLQVTITEMNEDCTGKFRYTLQNGAVLEERFIIFDNGRQFRSVPVTLASPAIPTLAWIGTGQRISKEPAPVHSCGPQTSHGSYLMTCENILLSKVPPFAVADTFLLRMDVSMQGDYTGMLYEKYGKVSVDGLPVFGGLDVDPNCSYTGTVNLPGSSSPVTIVGIFFNEGKEFYAMGIPDATIPAGEQNIKFSFCQGTRMGQQSSKRD